MDLINKISYFMDGFLRGYPFFIVFYGLITYILTLTIDNKLFLIFILGNTIINKFLKSVVFKNIMKNEKIPILGWGKRPEGAKNCGIFKNDELSTTYGMPSGHSQHAMAFPMYVFLNNITTNVWSISILIAMGFAVMASRVYFNCHTFEQVIVGGIFGVLYAYLFTMNKSLIMKYI